MIHKNFPDNVYGIRLLFLEANLNFMKILVGNNKIYFRNICIACCKMSQQIQFSNPVMEYLKHYSFSFQHFS